MNLNALAERLPALCKLAQEGVNLYEDDTPEGVICAAFLEAAAALRSLASMEPTNPAPGYCPHCKQYTIAEPLYAAPPIPADMVLVPRTPTREMLIAGNLVASDAHNPASEIWSAMIAAAEGKKDE